MRGLCSALRLLLVVAAAAACSAAARGEESAWKQAFDAAWTDAQAAEAAGNWDEAVRAYERVKRLVPFESLTRYNLARAYARLGRPREALLAATEAVEYGWCDAVAMVKEPAFADLRGDPLFQRALQRAGEVGEERQLIYAPAGLDREKPAPLIIALHGRGEPPHGFLPYWRKAADALGAVVVVPRGVTQVGGCLVSTWDAATPTSAPSSAPADRSEATSKAATQPAGQSTPTDPTAIAKRDPADIDLRASRRAVDIAIAFARTSFNIDDQQIVLAGFSQGGAVALRVLAAEPGRYAGVLTLGTLYNPADSASWPAVQKERAVRAALCAGALDRLQRHSERAAADLRAGGIETRLETLPGIGHEPPPDWAERQISAIRWILRNE